MAIQHSEPCGEVLVALEAAKAEMGMVGKSGEHTQYKYSKLEDYDRVICGPCAKNGLMIIESVDDLRFVEGGRSTSTGKSENACTLTLYLMVVDVASRQHIAITVPGEGQDRADKSTYKAITGARKYARALMFDLITTDDPEADETVGGATNGTKPQNASDATDDLDGLLD